MTKRGLRNGLRAGLLMLVLALGGCGSGNDADTRSHSAASGDGAGGGVNNQAAVTEAAPEAKAASAEVGNSASKMDVDEAGLGAEGGNTGAQEMAAGPGEADAISKKLVYHASFEMEVEDYESASSKVEDTVRAAGGYIVQFTESASEEARGGTFTFKVPAQGFSSLLAKLEKIPHASMERSLKGFDVTEEYVDLEARLGAKELLETQYAAFMKKATKASDLVAFANELNKVQEEIERIKGRMRYIDQNVRYSTIEMHLYQSGGAGGLEKKESPSLVGRAGDALSGTLSGLSAFAQWLFVFFAGALPFLFLAGVALAVFLLLRRRGQQRSRRPDPDNGAAAIPLSNPPLPSGEDDLREGSSEEDGQR
ncbi:DUF4349 domain-containing protein [Paenibacillus spiritus]|uniref:DUF4349 domain-containing protein n=1 Tax=Paenibacillus spiritus TaxID=2496557 RepID=A0A5J5GJ56_9BACL|nr:DUF4349 domain-containing protein [Paenibacillus spiritus]KAA9007524.1 DUF4349 domain-containing protein [Paenibacillus spiritus]